MMNQTEELESILDFQNATSGSVKTIQINVFIMIAHFICCVIGIPLNVFIASVIVSMRRLRSKPRNILLLGLILSDLSAFVPVLMEFAYLHFPSLELCRTYVAISGLPYILFLINTLLALVDRYTAIAHPLWHFNQVTPVLIVRCQLVASLTASFVYKFPYVVQFLPLSCELQLLQEFNSIAITLMILFSSCILAHVIVYRQTKRVLANYVPKGWKRGTFTSSKNEKRAAEVVTRSEGVQSLQQQPLSIFQQPLSSMNSDGTQQQRQQVPVDEMSIHISDRRVSQLEVEATRTMIVNVTSLSIMTGPFILFTLTVFLCRFSGEEQVGSSLAWLAPYLKELVVLHAVYHPAIQLSRSSELSSAMKQWLNR
jgi:dopamine receptor D1